MNHRNSSSGFGMQGRIDVQVHDSDELAEQIDGWSAMSKAAKHEAIKSGVVDPEYEQSVYNVTTDRFHQYFVDNLDRNQTASKDNVTAEWVALGTQGGNGTASSDTDLNNRTYSESVSDHSDNGKELLASTFLDSTEGNGNTFDEIGLFTGDPANLANVDVFMLNHATFSGVSKDSSNTVTFDVTLTFSDA